MYQIWTYLYQVALMIIEIAISGDFPGAFGNAVSMQDSQENILSAR